MNCQELETSIPDWARDSAIPDTALAHFRQCGRCAERLDEERLLTGRLAAFAEACRDDQAPARVEQKLRAAFRVRPVSAVVTPVRRRRRWVAIVAMGSVAAGVAWVKLLLPPVEPLPHRPAVIASVPLPQVANSTRAANVRRKVKLRRPAPPPVELETDFFPVAQGDDWTPVDGGRIMRVELPKSALSVFGLPAEQEAGPERVRADVVLSDDGLLRAIRFVR